MGCGKCIKEDSCRGCKRWKEAYGKDAPCADFEKRKTNADRIRSMTDEELAEWVLQLTDCVRCYAWTKPESWKEWDSRPCYTGEKPCKQMWLDWLKQEVE